MGHLLDVTGGLFCYLPSLDFFFRCRKLTSEIRGHVTHVCGITS